MLGRCGHGGELCGMMGGLGSGVGGMGDRTAGLSAGWCAERAGTMPAAKFGVVVRAGTMPAAKLLGVI